MNMFRLNRMAAVGDMDAINRRTWATPASVRRYARLKGWTDPGEEAAVRYVRDEFQGQPILDIGVGAGRTTAILRDISKDYVAIDYTAELVDACRRSHPTVQVAQMDARDLSAFAEGQFSLVVFSFNGIDAVNPADRRKILGEVHRVLKPGGVFLFSAHNRHGPGCGEKPALHLEFSWNPLKFGWRLIRMVSSLGERLRNYRKHRAFNELHDGWAIMTAAAHNFGIVIMYTSIAEQKRQLEAAGLRVEQIFDCVTGKSVVDGLAGDAAWLHYVARKPAGSSGSSWRPGVHLRRIDSLE